MSIFLLDHITHWSYYYRITNEYMGILVILSIIAFTIFAIQQGYISYLVTHLFLFHDVRQKNTRKNDEVPRLFIKLLNTVLVMGTVALSILILMKPYEGSSLGESNFLQMDNYLLWFLILIVLMILSTLRQGLVAATIRFLPDSDVIRDWDENTLNSTFLFGFSLIFLCLTYVLGYISVDIFYYILIILVLISLVIRALISVAATGQFNLVGRINFFIYLCTLEILPGLVGLKIILNQINQ